MFLRSILYLFFTVIHFSVLSQDNKDKKIMAEKRTNIEDIDIRKVCVDPINNYRYFATKHYGLIKEDSLSNVEYLFRNKEIYGAFVLDKKRKNGVFVAFSEGIDSVRVDTIRIKPKENKIFFSQIEFKKKNIQDLAKVFFKPLILPSLQLEKGIIDFRENNIVSKNKGYDFLKKVKLKAVRYETKVKNINDTSGRFQQEYVLNREKNKGLTYINTVFADEDHIWIGTYEQGTSILYRGNEKPILYDSRLYLPLQKLNKEVKTVYKIIENKQFVWIATNKGIYSIQKHIPNPKLKKELKKQSITSLAIRKNVIYGGDTQGNIWKRIITDNHKRNNWKKIEIEDTTYKRNFGSINDMIFDNNGNLWVAGNNILRLSRDTTSKSKKGESEFDDELLFDEERGFQASYVNSIAIDNKDKVWIGSSAGVYCIDNSSQKQFNIHIKSFKAFRLKNKKAKRTKKIKNIHNFQIIFEKDNIRKNIGELQYYLVNTKNKDEKFELTLSNINEGNNSLVVHDLVFGEGKKTKEDKKKEGIKTKEDIKRPSKQGKYKLVIFYDGNPISSIRLKL